MPFTALNLKRRFMPSGFVRYLQPDMLETSADIPLVPLFIPRFCALQQSA